MSHDGNGKFVRLLKSPLNDYYYFFFLKWDKKQEWFFCNVREEVKSEKRGLNQISAMKWD